MNQFTFERKEKTTLIGFMILGVLCMALSYFGENGNARFWSNFLHNSVFFTGIAFIAMFVLAAFITAYAGWYVIFKRVWEAYAQFLIVGLVLMCVVAAGIWGHMHHLYHWADEKAVATDEILLGKSGFLNKYWYTFGTIIIVGTWYFFTNKLRNLSLAEDREGGQDFRHHDSMRTVSAILLPIAAFSSAAVIWQWVMSVDAHWYSTLFAWYCTASWFVSFCAMTLLTLIYMKSKGYFPKVTAEHLHDIGKYMFGFSVFWTYCWFSQFMLIWYGNVGEETAYYHLRRNDYTVLFFGNLVLNFVLPFLILMRNSTKRKYGTLVFTSIICLFGHWWDFFYMIKPSVVQNYAGGHGDAGHADAGHDAAAHAGEHGAEAVEHASTFMSGFTIPGLLELGVFLGFLALFVYVVFHHMSKASLEPKNDPYLAESLHHHV
jgi:hypothetical protein